jgi:hypothetical protein
MSAVNIKKRMETMAPHIHHVRSRRRTMRKA